MSSFFFGLDWTTFFKKNYCAALAILILFSSKQEIPHPRGGNMDNKMTKDQYLDFIIGQITVLKDVCGAMVALHPHRKTIFELAKNVLDHANEKNASEYCKDGIKDIVRVLTEMLNSAVLAEQLQKQGLDTKFH